MAKGHKHNHQSTNQPVTEPMSAPPAIETDESSEPLAGPMDSPPLIDEKPADQPPAAQPKPAVMRRKPQPRDVTVEELRHIAGKKYANADLKAMALSMRPHLSPGHYHSDRIIRQNLPMPVHCHITPGTVRAFVELVEMLCG